MNRFISMCAALALGMLLVSSAGCSGGTQPSTPEEQQDTGSGENGGTNTDTGGTTADPSQGEALAREKCTQCHSFDRVESRDDDAAGWDATVAQMESRGLQVTAEERQAILDYLVSK